MRFIGLWFLVGFGLSLISACKRGAETQTAPILGQRAFSDNSYEEIKKRQREYEDELRSLQNAQKEGATKSADYERKIKELEAALRDAAALSAEQRKALEDELEKLKKAKQEADDKLKELAEQQAKTEKDLANTNSQMKGPSGYPFCGAVYYGDIFNCNGRECAKSDPEFKNICELSTASRPSSTVGSSGFPLCGAVYYGDVFSCNGKQCGKSDAEFRNICEITPTSKPVSTSSTSTAKGTSGFPFCGSVYYGDMFTCNGKQCGKSDPAFQNTCEITASSQPASSSSSTSAKGTSGFPFCGSVYYGSVFTCDGKQCAKSDAAFQNTCELTSTSRPATTTSSTGTTGSSGYPLCGGVYYGDVFTCNGKQCAKSDPGFQNICELSATSRPATTSSNAIGPSGYAYCGTTYYGSVFDCNGRRCAKSDPEFKNVCEIR